VSIANSAAMPQTFQMLLDFQLVWASIVTTSVVKWSEFLATDPEARVRFPTLPDYLRSSGSGTGSTQPREYN
jgi:hypothetical protein